MATITSSTIRGSARPDARLAAFLLAVCGVPDAWESASVHGEQEGERLGAALAAAGDLDGDGYGEWVVAAPGFGGAHAGEGRVLVFRGSASGPATEPSWILLGGQAGAAFGSALVAGDFDGDGFADLVVGAPGFDGSHVDEGALWCFRGGADGLESEASWSALGGAPSAALGSALALAVDADGDGYHDLLAGAPGFGARFALEGELRLYSGGPLGLAAEPSWSLRGGEEQALLGAAVAAGDVDGDGFTDLAGGAPGAGGKGRALLVLGAPGGPLAAPAWSFAGDMPGADLGAALAASGDLDGDGFCELVLGEPGWGEERSGEGRVLVFRGGALGLGGEPALVITGGQSGAGEGRSLAVLDHNGDGRADLASGAPGHDGLAGGEGRVRLFHGARELLDLSSPTVLLGAEEGAALGSSVAGAGDLDGDGYGELACGAPAAGVGGSEHGLAQLLRGTARPPGLEACWTFDGGEAGARLGRPLSWAGDVDGDGFDDFLLASPGFAAGAGRVQLFRGGADGPARTPDWSVVGSVPGEQLGAALAGAGDVDGDGYADVILGAWGTSKGEAEEGALHLFRGSPNGLEATPSWSFESDVAGARLGAAVAGLGDVNGDGYADVGAGAYWYSGELGPHQGRVYVFLGSPTGLSATPDVVIESEQADSRFGWEVQPAGDVDGDGYGDVAVGAYLYDGGETNEGRAYLFRGGPRGPATTPAWTSEGDQAFARYGISVRTAGDVDGDGYSDLLVGAYFYDDPLPQEGKVWLFRGGPGGLSARPAWSASGGQAFARFGRPAVAAGDVDGDGFGDVLIGAYLHDDPLPDEGRAYLFLGSPTGLASAPAWIGRGGRPEAHFGWSVAGAGDADGDGFPDLLVGANRHSLGASDEGRAYLFSANGAGGSALRPRQRRTDDSAPIQRHGRTDAPRAFRLALDGHRPDGRGELVLEWQVAPSGLSFAELPLERQLAPTASGGQLGALELSVLARGLASAPPQGTDHGRPHRWRARLTGTHPVFPRSPWHSISGGTPSEAMLRGGRFVAATRLVAPP